MPVDPAQAKQLADAGGWAVAIVTWALLALGWRRQWFVHGDLYREEKAGREKLAQDVLNLAKEQAKSVASYDRLRSAVMAALRERGDRRSAPP